MECTACGPKIVFFSEIARVSIIREWIFFSLILALLVKNSKLKISQKKMYAYYVEVPKVLISGSNIQFIPLLNF